MYELTGALSQWIVMIEFTPVLIQVLKAKADAEAAESQYNVAKASVSQAQAPHRALQSQGLHRSHCVGRHREACLSHGGKVY